MAQRWIDSCSGYDSSSFPSADPYTLAGLLAVGTGLGRFAGNALVGTNSGVVLTKILDSQPSWYVHFSSYPASFEAISLFGWVDGATAQVELRLDASGHLSVTRNGTVLATSTQVLSIGVYQSIEFGVTIHGTTGAATVKVDGITWLSLTGVNTKNSANATADRFNFTLRGSWRICDLYIADGTGSANNSLPGPMRVDLLLPTSDAGTNQWTPSTGTSHFALVDEAVQNGNTDYLSSLTPGNSELFGFQDVPTATTGILGVKSTIVARRDDAGLRQVAQLCKSNATTRVGTTIPLPTSYAFLEENVEQDPNTSAPWTAAGFNAAQFGVRVIS